MNALSVLLSPEKIIALLTLNVDLHCNRKEQALKDKQMWAMGHVKTAYLLPSPRMTHSHEQGKN
jgi:hypothetical protein